MSMTAQVTTVFEVAESPAPGTGGRTVVFWPGHLKLTGADRRHSQSVTLSAGLSAHELTIPPLGHSATTSVLLLFSDQPLDVRIGASGASLISSVYQLMLAAHCSALFVTTPAAAAATIALEAVGGSATTITVSTPRA